MDDLGNWKENLIWSLFSPIDAEAILKIKPSRRREADVLAWQPEPSGVFSVRSAYRLGLAELPEQCALAESSADAEGNNPCWAKIWGSSVPPKVKVFAWKAATNSLATEENKLTRNMRVTGICNICGSETEGVAHALAGCNHAKRLWEEMRLVWSLPSCSDFQKPSRHWFQSVLSDLPSHLVDTTLLVAWRIWYARNEVTHEKPLPSVEGSKMFLCSYLKLIHNAKEVPTDVILKGKMPMVDSMPLPSPVSVKKGPDKPWTAPPSSWIKLSIDGSFNASDNSAGIGMGLRNDTGFPIFTACQFLDGCSGPLEAELRAGVEGLSLALFHSHLPIIVETDCSSQVVAAVNSSNKIDPLFYFG
jgi:hypothetical protein